MCYKHNDKRQPGLYFKLEKDEAGKLYLPDFVPETNPNLTLLLCPVDGIMVDYALEIVSERSGEHWLRVSQIRDNNTQWRNQYDQQILTLASKEATNGSS